MKLKQGATGIHVTKLQRALQQRNLYSGKIDGKFGPLTTEAVMQYQREQNLKADGVVGKITAASLGIKSFRILSFDGGGIRGVISARILLEVERQILASTGQPLHEYFDMVAGTSTGSIITAAIARQLKAEQILDLYQENAARIFPQKKSLLASKLQPIASLFSTSKYSNDGLTTVLREKLEDVKISEINDLIVLILAYDMRYRNTTFFTNCHPDQGYRWYDDTPLWQISAASSSAPTFFPPLELRPEKPDLIGDRWSFPHVDGGVSANNPTLAAISHVLKLSQTDIPEETKQKYKLQYLQFEDISVLSISTGRSGEPYEYEQIQKWKPLDWVRRLTDVFMEPTSEIDARICRNLLGGYESSRYLRLEFDLNERFEIKPDQNFKQVRSILPEAQRTNRFTGKALSEAMDDSREETIQDYIKAADAFIQKGHSYYTRDDQGPLVKDAIAAFIRNN